MSRSLVIVGGGNAGLAAAVSAGELGVETLLIEKTERLGGQLHWSSGHFSAAGTRRQRIRGIDDDAPSHAADVMRLGHNRGTPHLIELATTHAAEAVDWLEDVGFPFSSTSPAFVSGHELYGKPRTYWGGEDPRTGGQPIFETLLAALDQHPSVETWLGRTLTDLVIENHEVVGVVLDGGEVIEAGVVILATGGYAANRQLIAELQAPYGDALTGCLPHATGDALRILIQRGVEVIAADSYVPTMGMIPDPAHPGFGVPLHRARLIVNAADRLPWEIWVDERGRRFVNEQTLSPFEREKAVLQLPGLAMAAIWDESIFREAPPVIGPDWSRTAMREEAVRGGWLHRCETLAELADRLGVDRVGLHRTVVEWNEGESVFGRHYRPRPIESPPYWGVRSVGGMLLSRGGPKVDHQLQPMIGSTPITNLHCVGELLGMGQFSGDSFAGGMSVGPALALGRWIVRHRFSENAAVSVDGE